MHTLEVYSAPGVADYKCLKLNRTKFPLVKVNCWVNSYSRLNEKREKNSNKKELSVLVKQSCNRDVKKHIFYQNVFRRIIFMKIIRPFLLTERASHTIQMKLKIKQYTVLKFDFHFLENHIFRHWKFFSVYQKENHFFVDFFLLLAIIIARSNNNEEKYFP